MDSNDTDLDFSFDMRGVDRQALLAEAAERLDALSGFLGPGDEQPARESPESVLARELMEDDVEFAGFPVVYRISDKDFLTRNLKVPVRYEELARAYSFYGLYFPIALFPRRHWGFNRLEFVVSFNPDESVQHLRPKAYEILPAKKFQNLIDLNGQVEVRLNEQFEFSAETETLAADVGVARASAGAGVGAKEAVGLGAVIGPFVYHLKKARIDHTPVGMEKVRWRLDGAEFFQEDDPPLIVILQVPKETQAVTVAAAMQAYRYFSFASAGLQQAVKQLPAAMRNFFNGGMPVYREASWDITPRL
ncbi:MAG TPA: hypothetical protein VKV40_24205 [Ktedonobacteraceae bacterium]|nr:hypothetical protein [Ktedonobacteraceae bacterium]